MMSKKITDEQISDLSLLITYKEKLTKAGIKVIGRHKMGEHWYKVQCLLPHDVATLDVIKRKKLMADCKLALAKRMLELYFDNRRKLDIHIDEAARLLHFEAEQ